MNALSFSIAHGVGQWQFATWARRFSAILLLPFAAAPSAGAWGCKGHEIVALIAQRHLTDRAHKTAVYLLTAAPTDPNLSRDCPEVGDRLADASTWADDVRRVRPETRPWHFIDLPRGAPQNELWKSCPPRSGCIITALAEQVRILRDPSLPAAARADALRFAIHFLGDIHQPLHASTNNDLGGNCVPVTFFGHAPAPSMSRSAPLIPNLHEVWDVEIVERFSTGKSAWDIANELEQEFSAPISAWQAQRADFAAWAWESHELAEKIVYGRLPHPLPIETPRPLQACVANGELTGLAKMPEIDENLGEDYQEIASSVVREQLAKAGARLAALLNSL